MVDKKIVGRNIQTLRENAGYTQSNLAKFLQVDQSLISKIEKGERAVSTDMLEKIASLFGITVNQLTNDKVPVYHLSFAFRGSDFTVDEMQAISNINKIALNSDFMQDLLKR